MDGEMKSNGIKGMTGDSQPASAFSPVGDYWKLVERVANSRHFAAAPKLRAFLLYICENYLLGRQENIREQLIGHAVFGRVPDYSIGEDNIVRVEARELRKRLQLYFASEGRDEPFLIQVPKGGYVPVFKSKGESRPSGWAAQSWSDRMMFRSATPAMVLVIIVLLGACFALWKDNRALQARMAANPVHSPRTSVPEQYAFYEHLLGGAGMGDQEEALVVLSNPKLLLYFDSEEPDLISRNPDPSQTVLAVPTQLQPGLRGALNIGDDKFPNRYLRIVTKEFTGMGEAICAYEIGKLMRTLNRRTRITQGRFLNWDRLKKQESVIVLGAAHTNPWTYNNFPALNFRMTERSVTNSNPLPGELPVYHQTPQVDFGIVSMTTMASGARILLLTGRGSPGTAGTGQFFADPEKMRPVYEKIRAASSRPVAEWEVLLKLQIRDAVPVDGSLVAFRVH
jgi:hypothetical protein